MELLPRYRRGFEAYVPLQEGDGAGIVKMVNLVNISVVSPT